MDNFTLNRKKVTISFVDETGLPIVHNGVALKSEDITRNLTHSNLKLDPSKLYGTDNFIIDAKRLKCTINLPNNNISFKNALIGAISDTRTVIQDSLETQQVKAIIIDKNIIEQTFSVQEYWGSDYLNSLEETEIYPQTWSTSLANSGKLVLKSTFDEQGIFNTRMLDTFSAMMWNFLHGWGGGGYRTPGNQSAENNSMENNYNRGFDVSGYSFDVGAYNIIDFLARGLQIWKGLENSPQNTNYGLYFEEYLNSIYAGFGTALGSAVKTYHLTRCSHITNLYTNKHDLYYLFNPVKSTLSDNPNVYKCISRMLWKYVDDFIVANIGTYSFEFFLGDTDETGEDYFVSIGLYNSPTFNNRQDVRLAGLLCSIIQYSWYQTVCIELINNQMQKLPLANNQYTSYFPFYRCMETVVGVRQDYVESGDVPNAIIIDINGYANFNIGFIAYHKLFNNNAISNSLYVNCLKNSDFTNKIKFGSAKTLTRTTNPDGNPETQDGLSVFQINPDGTEYVLNNDLFVPVKKLYYFKGNTFYTPANPESQQNYDTDYGWIEGNDIRLLINQFDYNKFASNLDSNTILFGTGFEQQNWMWFDNVGVLEIIKPYENSPAYQLPRIEIPVFDEANNSELDEYGLYIYSDAVQNYYTKKPSPFLSIYVTVHIDNNKIYHGVIDRNTVSITNKQLSFEATDAIGVLIENIQTLNQHVYFSQFDTENGFGDKAILPAGTTIKDFIEELIKNPFPYNVKLGVPSFELPNELTLSNKVLNLMSTEDAFVTGIQMAKKLLYVDSNGRISLADLPDIDGTNEIEIDGSIISISKQLSSDYSRFSIDKLKNISGWQKFVPAIASYYNSFKTSYPDKINIQIFDNIQTIKLLDKIILDGTYYIVTEIDYELLKKSQSINLIKIQ